MKGVNLDAIRNTIASILEKVDVLLTTEPARAIGYGAAVVIFLVVQGLGYVKPGLLPPVSFDEAIGFAFAAIVTLTAIVESIRKFVYSPLTYIEDLAAVQQESYADGHIDAHEEINDYLQKVAAQADAASAPTVVPVGPAPDSVN